MYLRRISGIVCLLGIHVAQGQMSPSLPPYQPARSEVLAAYKEATRLDSLAKNSIFKNNIKANWQPDNKGFWYRNSLPNNGTECWYVDARTGAKTELWDTTKLIPTKDNGFISGGIKSRWERQRPSD